jgi:hypothetical protein
MAQNGHTIEIPLHDIKPLVEIEDYSLYYLLGLSVVVGIVLLALLYLVYRYIQQKNRYNIRKEHYKILQNISLTNTKKAAYALTKYGLTFKNDNERNAKTYEELLEKLARYKYKKDVESFDSDTQRVIELYRGMIDV